MPIKRIELVDDPSGALEVVDGKVRARAALAAGTFNYKIKITDAEDWTQIVSGSFVVAQPVVALAVTSTPPASRIGTAYSYTLTFSGGTAPYTTTASGLANSGLTLSNNVISGTPTGVARALLVQITITDATGASTTVSQTINIAAQPQFMAANNIVAPGGDSTGTTTGPYSGGLNQLRIDSGAIVHARQLLQGKIDFNRARVFGTGGITSTTYRNNSAYFPAALASDAGWIDSSIGINDVFTGNSVTLQQSKDNLDYFIAQCKAAGKGFSFCDLWPIDRSEAQNAGHLIGYRDYARSKHDPINGIICVRTYDATASAPDATTPKVDALSDGLHRATLGADLCGRQWAEQVGPYFPVVDLYALTWANSYDFTGTTGTVSGSQTTGTAPTGCTVAQGSMTAGSLVCSVVVENGVSKLRLIATDLGNGSAVGSFNVRGLSNALTGIAAGTDAVDTIVTIEIAANPNNGRLNGIGQISSALRRDGGNYFPSSNGHGSDASYGGSQVTYNGVANTPNPREFAGLSSTRILRPPAFVLPSGATQLYLPWIDFVVAAGKTANFDIRLSRARNRVKTTLIN